MKSDNVKKGMQQAPHRSLFNALGFTKEELDRPLVGVVSSYSEIVPGHMNLDKITENGRRHGGRNTDRGSGYRSLRRYRHGTCGYEILSGHKRAHC